MRLLLQTITKGRSGMIGTTTFWFILMLPAWCLIIGMLDYLVFAPRVRCPICEEKLIVKWWWFIIPTFLELMMLVAGYVIGRASL